MKVKLFFLILATVLLALPFIYKLPIPADTIPGLYYPMKDLTFGYPNGVPVENPLITDPVRQQFVWKNLAVEEIKNFRWPLWNPYTMAGTPLLANFQTGAFYPGNLILYIPNLFGPNDLQHFATLWSYFIYLQIPLSIFFMYLYLRKIGLGELSALYGGGVWAFSGFVTAWWEWGNVVHTLLYLPLILYAIENLVERDPIKVIEGTAIQKSLLHTLISLNRYKLILIFALTSSFFAGHLQTFIVVAVNTLFYILYKIPLFVFKNKKLNIEATRRRLYYWLQLLQIAILTALIIAIQALPTLDLLSKSARNVDAIAWQRKDWFYPTEHLVSLLAPDFFGNPSTYNYWGVWNYGEFASYIGILPLIFALSIIFQFLFDQITKFVPNLKLRVKNKQVSGETLDIIQENTGVGFFLIAMLINLVFITRNPFTHLVYSLNIPFLTTTQPSRGIALVNFSMIVLSAVGFHKAIKVLRAKTSLTSFASAKTMINYAYLLMAGLYIVLWLIVLTKQNIFNGVLDTEPSFDIFKVARSNLILPTLFFIVSFICLRIYFKTLEKEYTKNVEEIQGRWSYFVIGIILTFTVLDVGRFFLKFQTFSKREFLYPEVNILQTLQQDNDVRYMTDDSRIMAPNMNMGYKLKTTEGYDPLYLDNYGKLIGLWQRNEPDLSAFPANRILTPHNTNSIIADISAANYLIALNESNLEKIGESGLTKLYKRTSALPRVTIFSAIRGFETEQQLVNYMFSPVFDPTSEALFIVKPSQNQNSNKPSIKIPENGLSNFLGVRNFTAEITEETSTTMKIKTTLKEAGGLLYIADTFDEGWSATIDGQKTKIIKANFAFKGIILSQGNHEVELKYEPQSFTYGLYITTIGLLILAILITKTVREKRRF